MNIRTKKVKTVRYGKGLRFTIQFFPRFRMGSHWRVCMYLSGLTSAFLSCFQRHIINSCAVPQLGVVDLNLQSKFFRNLLKPWSRYSDLFFASSNLFFSSSLSGIISGISDMTVAHLRSRLSLLSFIFSFASEDVFLTGHVFRGVLFPASCKVFRHYLLKYLIEILG